MNDIISNVNWKLSEHAWAMVRKSQFEIAKNELDVSQALVSGVCFNDELPSSVCRKITHDGNS